MIAYAKAHPHPEERERSVWERFEAERAALVGAQLLGVAVSRYILGTPPLAGMDDADLIAWLGPVIEYLLTHPAPSPAGQPV